MIEAHQILQILCIFVNPLRLYN